MTLIMLGALANHSSLSVPILGSRVHVVDLCSVAIQIEAWIIERRMESRHIVITGFHGLWEAHKSPAFKRVLASADLWVPDGIAPVWVARLKGFKQAQRVPGAELMEAFFKAANQHGYRSYFYGDTQETLEDLKVQLARRFPRHVVAGAFSPPFRPLNRDEDEAIIRQINEACPDVLWVGLGLPKQERWIFEHRHRLRVPVIAGVGAAFGFLSQRVRRCPRWIGESGFEWAYRLLMEPKKLWRRDLLDGPQFLIHVLLELSGLRKYD